MNLKLKILLFFNYFNIFCRCNCYNIKYEQNNEINNNNNNNNNNKDVKPPVDDNKDKKPPVINKNRRESYFRWNNNCAVQVFAMTFFIIFRDNPEGLKLLEDSNILFFQKIAKMCKDYYDFKENKYKKNNPTDELQEIYKEYCRFLVNESLKIVDNILKFLEDNKTDFDTLNENLMTYSNDDKINYINGCIEEFGYFLNKINYFANNYNLETAKNYDLHVEENYKFIDDLWDHNMGNFEKIKIFCTYYKNDFAKNLLKTIEKTKSYGFNFHIYDIFYLLKKYIPNIENNKKIKNLEYSDNKNINENTIFIKLKCGLGANLDISKKESQNHSNCIYKDIDEKWWYAYGYNEEFLIDENLIKQKKFKEIVANNFGTFHYTFFSTDGFINIKI